VAANLGRYGSGLHATLWELGVLLAVYDGAEVVLKPVFGHLVDRVGAKAVLLLGLGTFALASVGFVAAGDPGLLGVARLGQGIGAAAFSPAAGALVATAGRQGGQGRSFGSYGMAKGLGYLSGPLVGGALVVAGGYPLLFGLLALVATGVGVVVALRVPSVPATPRGRETVAGLARRFTRPGFFGPVATLGGATAALAAGVGFLPVVGARDHLGPIATGAVVSVLAGVAALVQPRVGRARDAGRLQGTSGAGWGVVLAGAGLVLAAVVPGIAALVVAAAVVGTGVGLATPLGFAAVAEASPEGRLGQTMGAAEVGRELGDAGGPLLVGALAVGGLGLGLAGLGLVCGAIGFVVLGVHLGMRPSTGGAHVIGAHRERAP
jgi:MFS family permease